MSDKKKPPTDPNSDPNYVPKDLLADEDDDSMPSWAENSPQAREMVYARLKAIISDLIAQLAEAEFATLLSLTDSAGAIVAEIKPSLEELKLSAQLFAYEGAFNALEDADPMITCQDCGGRHMPTEPHPSTLS